GMARLLGRRAQPPLALERAFGGRGGALALLDLEAHAEIAGERALGGAWRAALEHPAIGAVVAAHAVFDLVGRAGVVGAQARVEPAREILRVHDARPTVPVRVLRAVAGEREPGAICEFARHVG